MLGTAPTGEPQAELWLGDHPGSPATVAKASPVPLTLIELIESDPELYGVNGGPLPFLLKVLAIGAPLSLQAHPNLEQARAGFAAENAAGVPLDAPHRNYRDDNHKPELLVALSEVTALSGFRPIAEAIADIRALAELTGEASLATAANRLAEDAPEVARQKYFEWAFSGSSESIAALSAISGEVTGKPSDVRVGATLDEGRRECLTQLVSHYPGDPGVLVSLLLHHVRLASGEAIYLGAQQLHAYLSGIAIEVMAASDNVLRAGLTPKHVDLAEMLKVLDPGELDEPRIAGKQIAPGLVGWVPGIPDFKLYRVRLRDSSRDEVPRYQSEKSHTMLANDSSDEAADEVVVAAPEPLVLLATQGRLHVSRPDGELAEMANVARGQSLYISAGQPIRITGTGEAFLATVGDEHPKAQHPKALGRGVIAPREH